MSTEELLVRIRRAVPEALAVHVFGEGADAVLTVTLPTDVRLGYDALHGLSRELGTTAIDIEVDGGSQSEVTFDGPSTTLRVRGWT